MHASLDLGRLACYASPVCCSIQDTERACHQADKGHDLIIAMNRLEDFIPEQRKSPVVGTLVCGTNTTVPATRQETTFKRF